MAIELLHPNDVPSWERAWNDLGRPLATAGIDTDVRRRRIDTLGEEEGGGRAWTST